jgi:two-component system, NarL family, invasion response regulator UvrY
MKALKVFIVDDHGLMREGLRAMLQSQGVQVVGEADDAQAAVAAVLRTQPDVLLLDIGLAQRSGLDVLARLRAREAGVEVVLLTMSARIQHVARAWRLGARAYVLKGSPSAVLMQGIRAAKEGARFLDPALAQHAAAIEQCLASDDALAPLSISEREIMWAVVRGASSREIGKQLHLSSKSVDTYRSRLMGKLAVPDLPALVRLAVRTELLDPHNA